MRRTYHRVTIRVALGTLFVLMTTITIAVAVSLQYYFYKQSELDNTLVKYHNVASNVKNQVVQLDRTAVGLINKAALSFEFFKPDMENPDYLIRLFSTVLAYDDNIYSVYLADSQENLFQVIDLETKISKKKLLGREDESWLVVYYHTTDQGRVRTLSFYNDDLVLTRTAQSRTNLLPSLRPWYQNARFDKVHKTEPYLFNHLNITGQTYSKRISNTDLVIGLDYTQTTIQSYLRRNAEAVVDGEQEFEAYLFLDDGRLIATNQNIKIDQDLPVIPSLALTAHQRDLIQRTPILRVSSQLDWEPIDFAVSGQPYGYAIDLMNLISHKTGLKFNYINGLSWPQLVEQYYQGRLDILHSVAAEDQSSFAEAITLPLFRSEFALASRESSVDIDQVIEQTGYRIGVLAGWTIQQRFEQTFPQANFVFYTSLESALEQLEVGEIDAVLDNRQVLSKKVDSLTIDSIELTPISPQVLNDQFRLVLTPEYKYLKPILSQAIEQINRPKTLQYLSKKWSKERPIYTHIPYDTVLDLSQDALRQSQLQSVMLNGQSYYLFLEKLATSEPLIFAVLIPEQQIVDLVNQRIYQFILYSLVVLLLLLPVVWFFAIPVVRPIKQIEQQAKLIARRRYDDIRLVPSRVKELHQLSRSMCNMAKSLDCYQQEQQVFIDSFIQLVADAIDEKSPYTGGHCMRVPELAMMLIEQAQASKKGTFADFGFNSEAEWREFRVAAWLHDCGKITTPEYVVDKATKLETNYNRIHEVRTRFEVLWRDAKIDALQSQLDQRLSAPDAAAMLSERFKQLTQQFEQIAKANLGGEFMSDDEIAQIIEIGQQTWQRHFDDRLGLSPNELARFPDKADNDDTRETLLGDKPWHVIERERQYSLAPELGINMAIPDHLYNLGEIYNLSIRRGTLTAEERFKINEHMISGIKMLNNIPFPEELKRVPQYATTHHETLKGSGYPRKLAADQLSIPERVLAIADVFEALTASDRPYKQPKTLSQSLDIMHFMVKDQHLDGELFRLFIEKGVYLTYAKQYLAAEQIDEVEVAKYLHDA
ncbi:MAG: HD domain-containing phosphohydrolase [Pseudomonadota bacterium]